MEREMISKRKLETLDFVKKGKQNEDDVEKVQGMNEKDIKKNKT